MPVTYQVVVRLTKVCPTIFALLLCDADVVGWGAPMYYCTAGLTHAREDEVAQASRNA
jgi:hypothetical protein